MANYNNRGNQENFDLNKYETVKSRKTRLRQDHPNSVIMPIPLSDVNYAANYILMGALIWKDKEQIRHDGLLTMQDMLVKTTPQNAGLIMTTIAILTGADGSGFSLSIAGGKGADKNAWVENAEESAVGRALDNMGYHSGSASQEEMIKVQHMQQAQQERTVLENQIHTIYGALMNQGHNPQYLQQVVSQAVRPFQQLTELSPDELQRLLNALQAIQNPNQGQQQQQAQQQQQPQMNLGVPAPPPMGPGPR